MYSIAASSVRVKDGLMRYVDTFKHVKLLSRRERATYFPKALRAIKVLVDAGILLSVDVTNRLEALLNRLGKIGGRALAAVVDDCSVGIVGSRLGAPVIVAEGSLRRRKVTLEDLELKPSVTYVLLGVAGTLVAYARVQVEDRGKRLKGVRSGLPLKWSL